MSQSNTTASSEQEHEDTRTGVSKNNIYILIKCKFEIWFFKPFAIVPKYDCPHLGDRAYILLQPTKGDENQQAPCTDCKQTKENWACLHEDCEYVS